VAEVARLEVEAQAGVLSAIHLARGVGHEPWPRVPGLQWRCATGSH
jgi:hypothetical protein